MIAGMSMSLEGPNGSRWYTAQEAAELLGVQHQTIHKVVERGNLVPITFANISVFNSRDLEAYLIRRRPAGRPRSASTPVSTKRSRRAS